jgi:hypothetical protein
VRTRPSAAIDGGTGMSWNWMRNAPEGHWIAIDSGTGTSWN